MENYQQGKEIEKFTWVIENFSKKNTKKLRSKSFQVGGCKWQIHVHRIEKAKGMEYLSLYLKVGGSVPSFGWSKYAYFSLALINHMDPQKSVVRETQQKFNAGYRSWGSSFVALNDFYDPKQGYLLNNVCIIEVRISVSDVAFDTNIFNINNNNNVSSSTHHSNNQTSNETLSRSTSTTTQEDDVNGITTLQPNSDDVVHYVPTAPPLLYPTIICDDEPLVVPLNTTTLSEILDVKSLGEEKAYVPLLEEVCSWHPLLIQSQMRKSPKFIQWAFIALGQVLHFLKTTKAKDMDENAFNKLQCLWEELQLFGFELSWLEPHVESALDMKDYLERVKTLKENVIGLEIEMKMLRAKMAVAEIDLELAKRDLEMAEVQMGFEEKDMDKELGYGYGYGYVIS